MARPTMDRVEIKIWVKRSAAQWLAAQAAERGLSRSAYVRGLLTERTGAGSAVIEAPKREASAGPVSAVPASPQPASSGACGTFKPRPGSGLLCFHCARLRRDHR